MRAKFINEKFSDKSDPIKDMGIGSHLIYDITPDAEDGEGFEYKLNKDAATYLIKKYISGISDNEIDRFISFTLYDIINTIPITYFENKDYKKIDKYIEQDIASRKFTWMDIHSDKAMKRMMR